MGREDRQGGEDWGRGGRDNGACVCVWGGAMEVLEAM